MPYIQTERGRFHYLERPGQQPTLIFLHGNLGSARWWQPMLSRLPQGWRGLAPDALGYGLSERSDELTRQSVPARLRDLIAIIQALNLPPVHLVAHSTATPVAIEYTLMAPEQVSTLTLMGPVPATGVKTPAEAYPLLERLSSDPEMLAEALHASAPHLPQDDALFTSSLEALAGLAPLTLSAIARGLDAWQPGERLRQLTLPVMLVRGQDDIMLEEKEAHLTLLAIPGAGNLEIIHGAGHCPMIETPETMVQLLINFIAEDWDDYASIRQSAL
jgi:pimeloyl-ACP methyl ester carboxylesterase